MQNLYNDLEKLLKETGEFAVNNKLNKSRIADAAYKYSETLLQILLGNAGLRNKFFLNVGEATVFKQSDFLNFLKNKDFLPDSFTEYKNQIGLQDEHGEYFRENKDVVLAFPYKDCVLEGGQDKEDQKRNEIFYNETLAPDEITRLFDTKALSNFKLYNSHGEQRLTAGSNIDFSQQNLIIKGNNLLALHTLKNIKSIAGQVKLIYIDPPYNNGIQTFHYNDKFNHSTWMVFMKNRLEACKPLLAKEGSIWINIDDKEAHYLKVICDEIYGRENFVTSIIWQKKHTRSNDAKYFSDNHDHILVYAKNKNSWQINLLSRSESANANYVNPDNDSRGVWASGPCHAKTPNENMAFEIVSPGGKSFYPPKGTSWRFSKQKFEELISENRIFFGETGNNVPRYKRFLTEVQDGLKPITIWAHTEVGHNQDAKEEIKALMLADLFSTPKPEKLLERIIEIATMEGDLVLDFFAGSGTTAAVALKMKRKFIALEQMDYVKSITIQRLVKVINGEQGGISESQNWKGGGSFVYAEIKRYNQFFIDEIEKATDSKMLQALYEAIRDDKGFFRIEIDHDKWNNDAFENLSLAEQKNLLCDCLDKNHLYVNLTEMEDAYYKMSKDDIALNKKFYNIS